MQESTKNGETRILAPSVYRNAGELYESLITTQEGQTIWQRMGAKAGPKVQTVDEVDEKQVPLPKSRNLGVHQ